MNKIKIGIITNGNFVDKYTYELIRWIKTNKNYFQLEYFISVPKENKKINNIKVFKKICFRFIIFFENLLLKLTKKHSDHLKKFYIKNTIKKKLIIENLKKNKLNKIDNQNIKKKI